MYANLANKQKFLSIVSKVKLLHTQGMNKKVVGLLFLIVLLVLGFGVYKNAKPLTPPAPQPNSQEVIKTPETDLLVDAAVWYPSAPWTPPASDTQATFYGSLSGYSITATVTQPKPTLAHFEDTNALKAKGFVSDNNLSADGPGSSTWGYVKTQNNKKEIMMFSYKTTPSSTNPNEPLQFNCPCKVNITVFVSTPF